MSERIQRRRTAASPHAEQDADLARGQTDTAGLDALLDEIDAVLSTDAEEYVKSFVQKGGQ